VDVNAAADEVLGWTLFVVLGVETLFRFFV
jgi:hypothetical protein